MPADGGAERGPLTDGDDGADVRGPETGEGAGVRATAAGVPAAPGAGGCTGGVSSSLEAGAERRPVSASITRRKAPRSSGEMLISAPASGVTGTGGAAGSERTARCIRGRGGAVGAAGCLCRSAIRTGAGRSPSAFGGATGFGAGSGAALRMIDGGDGVGDGDGGFGSAGSERAEPALARATRERRGTGGADVRRLDPAPEEVSRTARANPWPGLP